MKTVIALLLKIITNYYSINFLYCQDLGSDCSRIDLISSCKFHKFSGKHTPRPPRAFGGRIGDHFLCSRGNIAVAVLLNLLSPPRRPSSIVSSQPPIVYRLLPAVHCLPSPPSCPSMLALRLTYGSMTVDEAESSSACHKIIANMHLSSACQVT